MSSMTLARTAAARVAGMQRRDMDNAVYGGYSLENPRTSWDRVFSVEPSYTGKPVTQASSLQSMAVWACVRILSGAVGRTPLLTYKKIGEGQDRNPDHYLWRLLKVQANPYQTALRFKRQMQAWCCLWGNAYAEIEINGRNQVANLWPMRPDRMEVWSGAPGQPPEIPADTKSRDRGVGVNYTYTRNDGQRLTFPASRILHLRGIELDGFMGLSPIGAARQTVGLDQAALEYGARFFNNNGRPGGFISTANKLSSEGRKNLRETFEDVHRGLRGSHRIGILEEGLEYKDVGIPPEDMQFLQTRQFQAIDIARLFGVPPHMIAELSRATFSNIEHQSIEFVRDCLGDWFSMWETECTSMLLSDSEQDATYLEFLTDKLLQGDLKSRYEAYQIARNGGILNPNEIRGKENLNRYKGGDGYLQPLNMAIAGAAPAEATDPDGDDVDEVTDPDQPTTDPAVLDGSTAGGAGGSTPAGKTPAKTPPAKTTKKPAGGKAPAAPTAPTAPKAKGGK